MNMTYHVIEGHNNQGLISHREEVLIHSRYYSY